MSRKELMSAELRHQLSDRVEILEKVKAVFLIFSARHGDN